MRLPTAPRAKPAQLVLIPAADAFVPRRAWLPHGVLPRFPNSSPGTTLSSPTRRRRRHAAAQLGVGYGDERLTVRTHHAGVSRPGGARQRAGGARGARSRTRRLAAPGGADGILDLCRAVERAVRQQHAGESLEHEDGARICSLGCAPDPTSAANTCSIFMLERLACMLLAYSTF